jgi:hypothetical protein
MILIICFIGKMFFFCKHNSINYQRYFLRIVLLTKKIKKNENLKKEMDFEHCND